MAPWEGEPEDLLLRPVLPLWICGVTSSDIRPPGPVTLFPRGRGGWGGVVFAVQLHPQRRPLLRSVQSGSGRGLPVLNSRLPPWSPVRRGRKRKKTPQPKGFNKEGAIDLGASFFFSLTLFFLHSCRSAGGWRGRLQFSVALLLQSGTLTLTLCSHRGQVFPYHRFAQRWAPGGSPWGQLGAQRNRPRFYTAQVSVRVFLEMTAG